MSVNDDNIFISKVIYPFTKTIILIENNRKQEWGTTQGLPIQNKTLRTYFHSCTWSLPKSWPWNKTALKESPWKFGQMLWCVLTLTPRAPRVCSCCFLLPDCLLSAKTRQVGDFPLCRKERWQYGPGQRSDPEDEPQSGEELQKRKTYEQQLHDLNS